MVLVAEIANEGFIGTDFLRTHWIVIDFVNNRVTSKGEIIMAKCQEGQERACRVSVNETVVIMIYNETLWIGCTMEVYHVQAVNTHDRE